jgi:hypothetical protein
MNHWRIYSLALWGAHVMLNILNKLAELLFGIEKISVLEKFSNF